MKTRIAETKIMATPKKKSRLPEPSDSTEFSDQ
jgi:hypothetical protein